MELPFNTTQPTENKPVTVLGRTFASDEERRTYFREELRKQLPELKKIEGFPIGEDEDILRLSDPPYYTACPNPWINDFIAEWETEKAELEAQGKRVADFEVDEPYASDVSEGKNNPIYMAHSYHTKVPHPAIMRYILHYTQPGDIVFDGFAGTGMTGVAASMCGNPEINVKTRIEQDFKEYNRVSPVWGARRSICSDLSPIASFIAYNYNNITDVIKFEKEANRILFEVENECGWMYETKHVNGNIGKINYSVWSDVYVCSNCSKEFVYWDVAVDSEKGEILNDFICPHCKKENTKKTATKAKVTFYDNVLNQTVKQTKIKPVLINYTYLNKRYEKVPDDDDMLLIDKINQAEIPYFVPTSIINKGDKTGEPLREGISNIHHFYIKSNLWSLCSILDKVEKNSGVGRLGILFTSILLNSSKLYRWRVNGKGGYLNGTLYVASLLQINNPIKLFKEKISDFKFLLLQNNAVMISSANNLLLKSNSIDYIFTDPPFGSNLMYSELNILWESWLKVKTNNNKEAIENKTQGKKSLDYQNIMLQCFVEYFRILKPNKWLTVEFSNTSAIIWNGIQNALQRAGFVIANVAAIDKQQGSYNAVSNATSVKQDLVISCYKPSSEFDIKFQQSQHTDVGIWDFVVEHLSHLPIHLEKENATTAVIERSPKILFDRLIAFYVQRNLPVPIDAGLFQKGLKERFIERDGMYFTAEQVHEYDSKKAEVPNFVQLSFLVASEQDGVMWLRRELVNNPQTSQDIRPKWMQALAGVRKGDILPELRDILEENFLQNESGAWYLPDLENEIDLEKVRTGRMLRLFATYREQASKPKGKIKEARVEALRAGFKQCYKDKDFKTIVTIGDNIPNNLLMEDEVLLQYYDIAISRV